MKIFFEQYWYFFLKNICLVTSSTMLLRTRSRQRWCSEWTIINQLDCLSSVFIETVLTNVVRLVDIFKFTLFVLIIDDSYLKLYARTASYTHFNYEWLLLNTLSQQTTAGLWVRSFLKEVLCSCKIIPVFLYRLSFTDLYFRWVWLKSNF